MIDSLIDLTILVFVIAIVVVLVNFALELNNKLRLKRLRKTAPQVLTFKANLPPGVKDSKEPFKTFLEASTAKGWEGMGLFVSRGEKTNPEAQVHIQTYFAAAADSDSLPVIADDLVISYSNRAVQTEAAANSASLTNAIDLYDSEHFPLTVQEAEALAENQED